MFAFRCKFNKLEALIVLVQDLVGLEVADLVVSTLEKISLMVFEMIKCCTYTAHC